ncbi:hypothetical protein Bca101_027267 [Brassica carinata]
MEKESGDRVWAERIDREEGDEIDAEDGIIRYGSMDVVLRRSRSGAHEEKERKNENNEKKKKKF